MINSFSSLFENELINVPVGSSKNPQDQAFNTTHLVDTSRLDVAMDFLIHEFSKLFATLKKQTIKEDLMKLKPNGESDDRKIRDFWNLCTSIGLGYKLKNITKDFTNKSIEWSKEKIKIKNLRFESPIGCLNSYFEEIERKENFDFQDFINYLIAHHKYLKKLDEEMSTARKGRNPTDKDDPLIGIKMDDGKIEIRDGNRRLLTLIIQQINESQISQDAVVNVWVGEHIDTKQSYWLPTGFMMTAVELVDDKNCIEQIIREESEIGLIEFHKRVKSF